MVICLILITVLIFGCKAKEEDQNTENVQMGNPWKSYETLADAESASGIKLGIPETIGTYTADTFRVLNGELLEVRYTDGENEVTVRKQAGEEQDISGDYTEYPTITVTDLEGGSVTERTDSSVSSAIISFGGYSWSIHSPCDVSEFFIKAVINP